MPTANAHYRRSEELLTQAYDLPACSGNELGALLGAVAHAVLALAATNGADRPGTVLKLKAATAVQGEPIEQMGEQPDEELCPASSDQGQECVRPFGHFYTEDVHVDAEGREFR